jgi:hypothetical protein
MGRASAAEQASKELSALPTGTEMEGDPRPGSSPASLSGWRYAAGAAVAGVRLGDRTETLKQLVLEAYARGLLTSDVEAALASATGDPILSRSGVGAVTEVLCTETAGRTTTGRPTL